MKFKKMVAVSLLAIAALPASAQAQEEAGVVVGAMVYGPQGGEVGTVEQVSGGAVVVNTGTNMATLGADSFVKGENGPVIGYTKAQLDEALEAAKREQEAKLDAALVAGANLRSMDGIQLGSVKEVGDDGSVVIQLESGAVALGRNSFGTDDQGLIVLSTAAALQAAIAQTGS